MSAKSTARIVLPSLALVAACGGAIAFGFTHVWWQPQPETATTTSVPTASPAGSGAREEGSAAMATAQAAAKAVAAELAGSPLSPAADESTPVFDIARIEKTGDAVIAGRTAPGATVELLRNGESLDRAVADQSGQFVMVPPRLPAGSYELSLRSRLPDGTLATSKHGVVVALDDVPSTGTLPSPAAAAAIPGPAVADGVQRDAAVAPPPRATLVAALPDGGASSSTVKRRSATAVVSPGDSLWRISRITYGDGARYAFLYKANRERIRDPNRIFPGQIFVLPQRAR